MRFVLACSMGWMILAAQGANARDLAATPPDAGPDEPRIIVSKAGDGVGEPIDIVAASRARALAETEAAGASAKSSGARGQMPWGSPVRTLRVTGRFGVRSDPLGAGRRMHSGTDLAAPMGAPVHATSGGVVTAAGWNGGYGLFVAVDHGGGTQTRYGHMSRLAVARGQTVQRGQLIGFVGSTGRSTGPHLHYEVRRGGVATDPAGAGVYAGVASP